MQGGRSDRRRRPYRLIAESKIWRSIVDFGQPGSIWAAPCPIEADLLDQIGGRRSVRMTELRRWRADLIVCWKEVRRGQVSRGEEGGLYTRGKRRGGPCHALPERAGAKPRGVDRGTKIILKNKKNKRICLSNKIVKMRIRC